MKLLGIINVDFDVIGQILYRYSIFVTHSRKIWSIMGQYISYLYTSRKSMTHSGEKYCTTFPLNLVHI